MQTAWITMSKAMHRKKPSAEINVQALVVSFEEAGNPFEDDGGCLFTLDSKVIVDAAAMQLAQSSPVAYSNITTLLRKGSKREQNQSKSLCERMCLCNNGRLKNLP